MFVKVRENDLYEASRYSGCIMKAVESDGKMYGIDAVTGDAVRLVCAWGEKLFDIVDDADVPENILDQVCYSKASDHIDSSWQWAKDNHDNVYCVLSYSDENPLVKVRNVNEYDAATRIRWDKLTRLDPDDEDAVYGEDPISGDPIFNESEDYLVDVYDFDRYGGVVEFGRCLEMTMETHSDEFNTCDDCERVFWNRGRYYDQNMHYDGSDTFICENCYENNGWMTCEDCGNLMRESYACYSDRDNAYYCEDCYDQHRNLRLMHDYGYKPCPIFHVADSSKDNQLFYGVELEIDKGNDVDECLEDLNEYSEQQNLFYCKHDGSLDDGIEIVTHPCDIEYHLNKFPWADITRAAKDNGFKSHDAKTCGLHIHASRNGFGDNRDLQDLNIAKVIILVDRFWDELVNFSRRNYSQLDRWAKKPNAKIYSYDDEDTAKEKAKASGEYDRYKAVNLANSNTVEFRLFRGSLEVETIKATIQFVSNLIGYCKNASLKEVQEAKWADITNFVEYPELKSYLERRNLVNVPERERPEEPKPIERRFNAGDTVWFATENTGYEFTRGTVQSVNIDYTASASPLYVVISGTGDDERVNFLVDSEIASEEMAARFEGPVTVTVGQAETTDTPNVVYTATVQDPDTPTFSYTTASV